MRPLLDPFLPARMHQPQPGAAGEELSCRSERPARRESESALRSKHAEVGNGRFRKHLQANGLALNFGCINTRLTNGHACLPLAEQFKQLTDLQRAFGRASAAVCTGAKGVVLFIGHFRIDQRTGLYRLRDAMPTSRSAAVRRGFAARARCSAVWSDNVWEYDTPVSQGLTSSADAHAIRVATLLIDMKIGT